ncbi:MAG: hypothetical protein ACRDQ4_15365 [Pseudonocardiaceae bacterium]
MAVDKLRTALNPPSVPRAWISGNQLDVLRTAAGWLESADLQRLTAALGGPSWATQDREALLTWSASTLDTRRGAERWDAISTTWTTEQIRGLLSAAGPLGLLHTAAPSRASYATTVLLGGATTGNRLRTALARDLESRGVDLGTLVAVTAERALSDHEHVSDPDSMADRTEWANLLRYLADAFGPLQAGAVTTGGTGSAAWQDHQLNTAVGRNLRVLVAPSRSAHRRANTSDGLAFLLDRIPLVRRRHVLIITSAIYAPYQFFAGAPVVLSDGAEHVELVGTPTATNGDVNLLAQRIAQEIHAAVNAAATILRRHYCTTGPDDTPCSDA